MMPHWNRFGGMVLACVILSTLASGATLHVAPDGNDAWSGRPVAANATRTDGPLASLAGAREAVRRERAAQPGQPVTVLFRGGVYPVTETVVFTPDDSGTQAAPIRYAAFAGEKPILWGGRRIEGWKPEGNGVYSTTLPAVKVGTWNFRQLFADNKRQVRARTPNVDPEDPFRKGFSYVASNTGGFGCTVGCIHNRGDWLQYKVDVPADGEYIFWMRYGANNRRTEWKTFDMADRTVLIVDDQKPISLVDLPDTGGWKAVRWSRSAVLTLTKGRHFLTWKNILGGGLNIDAYALCDDPAWKPKGIELVQPAKGRNLVVIQAEKPVAQHGKQIQIASGGGSPTKFFYKEGDIKPEWAQAPDAEIHIFQSGSCRAFKEILSIASIEPDEGLVHVAGETRAGLRAGDRYFVENVREALDSAGEWYLDRRAGKLYFMPENPIAQLEVVAPAVCELVRFEGDLAAGKPVQHITFAGFTIRFTGMTLNDGCAGYGMGTKGVFHWVGARDCSIERCQFENCGRYALATASGTRNRFVRCTVMDPAQGGVLIIDSDHCEVSDCTMERLGAVYKHVAGIVMTGQKASDNLVAHNVIRDSARYGISCKNAGFRNVIESNALYRMCTETYDTGGIEVTQQNRTQRSMSVIRGSLVQFTFPNFAGNCEDNEFQRNIMYWTAPNAGLGRMGKDLEKTLVADHNLFFRTENPLEGDAGWRQWRKRGFGEHAVIADPLFRDPANDDYTLLPASPALKLGFKPIDLSNIGPRH
ncbi:MAG: right-handed parallel beta-helix repeat-containing protein [Lentisphaeria bacterium]|nr:right-handed parallel beta-helix repeat-containing protein [Lentisphaeria bacterium]